VSKLELAHLRSNHLNYVTLRQTLGMSKTALPGSCLACVQGKAHKASHGRTYSTKTTIPGHHLYLDVLANKPATPSGQTTGLWAVDVATRTWWAELTTTKEDIDQVSIASCVRYFESLSTNRVRKITCDMDSMFTSQEFKDFCRSNHIELEFAPRDRQDYNAVAEREWRTAKELTISTLIDANAPVSLWGWCLLDTIYKHNHSKKLHP
jgi:hypothetical protein